MSEAGSVPVTLASSLIPPHPSLMSHRIRLHDFWTTTPLADGRSRRARRFGRPRTLGPGETAWLVGDAPGPGTLLLNGEPVGDFPGGPFAFDVTARLLPRNEIWIVTDGPVADVALELRPAGA